MELSTIAIIFLILNVLLGVVLCFFGFKWIRKLIMAYGFIFGALIMFIILQEVSSLSLLYNILISLGAGIVVGLLVFLLYYVGIFILGAGAGATLCLMVINHFSLPLELHVTIPAIMIIILFGILTLNFQRALVIIFTSYIGASSIVSGLSYLIFDKVENLNLNFNNLITGSISSFIKQNSFIVLIFTLVLFVAGMVVQFTITAKNKKTA